MRRALKLVGALVVLAVAAVGVFLFLVAPVLDRLEEAEALHLRLRVEYITRSGRNAHIDVVRRQLGEVTMILKKLRAEIPDAEGAEVNAARVELSLRAAAAKKRLAGTLKISVNPSVVREFYVQRAFTVTALGDFRALVEFLHLISDGAEEVRELSYVRLLPAREDPKRLALVAHVWEYGYQDEEAVARFRKAKAKP